MKHIKSFKLFESSKVLLYRLIGGGQFGGSPIAQGSEPKPKSIITAVFATPRPAAINAMIEYSLDEGEDELTGKPIKKRDMRVLIIETQNARKPQSHEKFMDWYESDKDEMFVQTGKIIKVLNIDEWNVYSKQNH
jgi:hypothetical protein